MAAKTDFSGIVRKRQAMPDYVRRALEGGGVMEKYLARPAYQQNDYLAWIARGKLEATRQKRINQMLNELAQGGIYMKMKWQPKRNLK